MDQTELTKLFTEARQLAGDARTEFLAKLPPEVREQIEQLLAADESAAAKDLFAPITGQDGQGRVSFSDKAQPADFVQRGTPQQHSNAKQQKKTPDPLPDDDPRLATTNLSATDEPADLGTTQSQPQPSPEDHPKQIGRYKVLQEIGHGGMGTVYMAQQTEPVKRRVALKVIKAGMDSKEVIARFEAERQALAMMDHPNIARVLDGGMTDDGRPYFVMELVQGIPITQYCDNNQLTPDERLGLLVKVCRAIQHAHQKGIIHRDIKPSNVLVGQADGEPVPKVIDFGLAKALQHSETLTDKTMFTQFGQVVGTLEYMSPEQAEMNILDVDTRTDVYSLGVLLYELLTGSTPIGRDRLKSEGFHRILQIIKEEEAPRPSIRLSDSGDAISGISEQRKTDPKKLGAILKGDLDWIAVKALEKDRKRRYEAASELAADIERYLTDEPIEARPPSFSYRLQKTLLKHKGKFAAAATILLLLVAGLIGTGAMWFRAVVAEQNATDEADKARQAAKKERSARVAVEHERKQAIRAREDAEREREQTRFQLALSEYLQGNGGAEQLERVPKRFREAEWHLLRQEVRGAIFEIPHGYVRCLASSGEWCATISTHFGWSRNITLWNTDLGTRRRTIPPHRLQRGWPECLATDQTSRFLAVGTQCVDDDLNDAGGEIVLYDLDTGLSRLIDCGIACKSIVFSKDGSSLIVGGESQEDGMAVFAVKSLQQLRGFKFGAERLSLSPDGHLVAAVCDNEIRVWSLSSWQLVASFRGDGRCPIGFSPNGSQLMFVREGLLRVWDAEARVESKHPLDSVNATDFAYCSDGYRILLTNEEGLHVYDSIRGQHLMTLSRLPSVGLMWLPDMRRAIAGSAVWDCSDRHAGFATVLRHSEPVLDTDYSPDGRLVVTGGAGQTKVWNSLTGEPIVTLGGQAPVAFDPTGSLVATAVGRDWFKAGDSFAISHVDRLALWRLSDPDASTLRIKLGDAFSNVDRLYFDETGESVVAAGYWANVPKDGERSRREERVTAFAVATGTRSWLKRSGSIAPPRQFAGEQFPVPEEAQQVRQLSSRYGNSLIVEDPAKDSEVIYSIRSDDGESESILCRSFAANSVAVGSSNAKVPVRIYSLEDPVAWETTRLPDSEQVELYGRRYVAAAGGGVAIYDLSDGRSLHQLDLATHPTSVTMSGDHFAVSAAADGADSSQVTIGNIETGETKTLLVRGTVVAGLAFDQESSRLYCISSTGNRSIWDVRSGKELNEEWPENPWETEVSRGETPWDVVALGGTVYRLNSTPDPREATRRRAKSRLDAVWHREMAKQCEEQEAWFGCAVHTAIAATTTKFSSNAEYHRLHEAIARLSPTAALQLPDFVAEASRTPKPPVAALGTFDVESINKRTWDKVKRPTARTTEQELDHMKAVVRDFPRGIYFNTLGVAQYRAANYEAAVKACLKSVELLPQQDDRYDSPHAGDYAFLAMSHFQLGNKEAADVYRKKLTEAMKLDPFKDDEECLGFVKEVDALFDRELKGDSQEAKEQPSKEQPAKSGAAK